MNRAPEPFYPWARCPAWHRTAAAAGSLRTLAAIGILAQNSRVEPVPEGIAIH